MDELRLHDSTNWRFRIEGQDFAVCSLTVDYPYSIGSRNVPNPMTIKMDLQAIYVPQKTPAQAAKSYGEKYV